MEGGGAPRFLCAARARAEFHLTLAELDRLPCLLVRNPVYRRSAPMRLYLLEDLRLAEREKAAQRAAAPTAEQKAALRKQQERATTLLARAAVAAHKDRRQQADLTRPVGGCTKLPVDAWALVLQKLAESEGADPLRGHLHGVRAVCTAARACRDTRMAARTALHAFAASAHLATCEAPPVGLAKAVEDPTALSVSQLKHVLRPMGAARTGTKPVLAVRLMEELALREPSPHAPPALVWLARVERKTAWTDDAAFVRLMLRAQKVSPPHTLCWLLHGTHSVSAARTILRTVFPTLSSLEQAEEQWMQRYSRA